MCYELRNKQKELERLIEELHEFYDDNYMMGYLESMIAELEREIARLEAERDRG